MTGHFALDEAHGLVADLTGRFLDGIATDG
jgi:hypothetical protein